MESVDGPSFGRPPYKRPASPTADEPRDFQHPSHDLKRGGVKKPRTRSSGGKLTRPSAAQEELLDAALSQEPSRKRQSNVASNIEPPSIKRARSTWTETQQPGVEAKIAEQMAKTILQQPRPPLPKRPYTSPFGGSVAPPPRSHRHGFSSSLVSKWLRSIYRESRKEQYQEQNNLTRKNLRKFDKTGKISKTPKTSSSGGSDSKSGKPISIISNGFEIQAADNGILKKVDSRAPSNLDEITERLNRSRASPSPPERTFRRYVHAIENAGNETARARHMTALFREYDDDVNYTINTNRSFTAFPRNVGFNDGLSAPQPDYLEGPSRVDFEPFPVSDVSGAVVFKDDRHSATLPHLAGEWKGPHGSKEQTELQSSYDGAALVYGRNQALAHISKPDPPDHAAITTFVTDGKEIQFFANYSTPPERHGSKEKYHQYSIVNSKLVETYESFKTARKQLRNAQDYAREQAYELRDRLWEFQEKQDTTSQIAVPVPEEGLLHPPSGKLLEDEGEEGEDEKEDEEEEEEDESDEDENEEDEEEVLLVEHAGDDSEVIDE